MLILDINHYPLNNALQKLTITSTWVEIFMVRRFAAARFCVYSCPVEMLLSDLVVIWRAWVISQDAQWEILIPLMLWIAAVGE